MKKWIKVAVFAAVAVLAFNLAVSAQDSAVVADSAVSTVTDTISATGTDVTTTTDTPAETNPVLQFFFSYAGLVLLIQIVTGWILKTVPTLGKTLKQVTSWVVALGIAYVGKLYGYGLFADANTIQTIATGIGLGMVANYLYDAKTLESILSIFFANKKA